MQSLARRTPFLAIFLVFFLPTFASAIELGQGRILRVLDHQHVVVTCDGGTERVKLRPNAQLPRVPRDEAQRLLEGLASFEGVSLRAASLVQLRDSSGVKVVEATRLRDGLLINDRLPAVEGDDEFLPGQFDYPVVNVIDFEHVVLKTNVGQVKVQLAKVETDLSKVKHYEADKIASDILKGQFVQVRYDNNQPVKTHDGFYVVHLTTSHNKQPVNPRIPPVGSAAKRPASAEHLAGINATATKRRVASRARREQMASSVQSYGGGFGYGSGPSLNLFGFDGGAFSPFGYGYGPGDGKTVHVNGYYRANGTYVREHWRSPPSR